MKIFLDDVRDPQQCLSYMYNRIGKDNLLYIEGGWYIVRNFEQFQEAIFKYHKDVTHISFDHDLADDHYHESMDLGREAYENHLKTVREKTGYDCAKWMKDFYEENNIKRPIMFVHSMNPVGIERIVNLFK